MKVLILTQGTRGDVQPYAALAHALGSAGHEVVLAAPACYAPMAPEYDLRFVPVDDRWNRLTDDPETSRALETGYRGLRGKRTMLHVMRRTRELMAVMLDDMAAGAPDDVDLVVHHTLVPGHHLAEKLGVPAVPVTLQPMWLPTSAFPCPMWSPSWLPRRLNRASYRPVPLMRLAMAGVVGRWRVNTLGLPRRGRDNFLRRIQTGPGTVLQAFSRHVLPGPRDWPEHARTTGYWFLPAARGWSPPRRLTEFLESGEPPVHLGFGSMTGQDPRRVGRQVTEAVRRAGVRAVLVAGEGGIDVGELPEDVLVLDHAPHDWLFPRMAAVVHHGGAGTTATALAAGRPQVLCPFTGDQPFWARRMEEAGVAPAPLPQRTLTAEGLEASIRRATSESAMVERAEVLGARIRAEGGATSAVRILERLVDGVSRE